MTHLDPTVRAHRGRPEPRRARRLPAALAAVALIVAFAAEPPAGAEVTGAPLDFRATTTAGEPVEGTSLAGRWVLLDFWGTWCVPCIAAFPKLQRLQDEHAEQLTVVGLAFFSGTGEQVTAFAAEHGVGYTLWMGEDATIEKFGVIAFPSYFLIDPEGTVVLEIVGESGDLYEEVSALLPAAEPPVAP